MKAYILADEKTYMPRNVNMFNAMEGFRQLGIETVMFCNIEELNNIENEDIVVGGIGAVRKYLRNKSASVPNLDYPEELAAFYGRKIWSTTSDELLSGNLQMPVFIKPVQGKAFTGFCCKEFKDLAGRIEPGENVAIYCSDVINIKSEWRVFVRYGKILDIRHYYGDLGVFYDLNIVKAMIKSYLYCSPAAYALDIGVTDRGETTAVEVNDGYSMGSYGLDPLLYAKFLYARWAEIMDVEDSLAFDVIDKVVPFWQRRIANAKDTDILEILENGSMDEILKVRCPRCDGPIEYHLKGTDFLARCNCCKTEWLSRYCKASNVQVKNSINCVKFFGGHKVISEE